MSVILVAGASGQLGRHVVRELKNRGRRVRSLARTTESAEAVKPFSDEVVRGDLSDRASLDAACRGAEIVFSCAGASLSLNNFRDRQSYRSVDFEGNVRLLEAAKAASVEKFVHVSMAESQQMSRSEYVGAHEGFVERLAASGVPYTVVRPTGFFYVFLEILDMARKNRGIVIGSGENRTNPIHEAELAEVCADAVFGNETETVVGGPEILTRRRVVELAFEALGKKPRLTHVPGWTFSPVVALVRPFNPRLAALMDFGRTVCQVDVVAPAYGKRTLSEYFAERLHGRNGESR